MKLSHDEIPQMVSDLWNVLRLDQDFNTCHYLNPEHKDSDKWGADVYYLHNEATELYVALAVLNEQLIARELMEDERRFIIDGTIPE